MTDGLAPYSAELNLTSPTNNYAFCNLSSGTSHHRNNDNSKMFFLAFRVLRYKKGVSNHFDVLSEDFD
jgi:hypothetical protein